MTRTWLVSIAVCVAFSPLARAEVMALLISCDGLRPDAITPERTPNLHKLKQAGVYCAHALNDIPSVTLPNHTGMLTGLSASRHRVLTNGELSGELPYATLLDRAHDAGLRTALYASKKKLRFLAHAAKQEVIEIDEDPASLTAKVVAALRGPEPPDVIFVHLREPDVVGHADGWMSDAYLAMVARVDGWVGDIVSAADSASAASAPDLSGAPTHNPYILVTADHGGSRTNHSVDLDLHRIIPWILVGPDIPSGRVLDDVATQLDTTPTLMWLLDLPADETLTGRPIVAVRGGLRLARAEPPVPAIGSTPPGFAEQVKRFRPLWIAFAACSLVAVAGIAKRRLAVA